MQEFISESLLDCLGGLLLLGVFAVFRRWPGLLWSLIGSAVGALAYSWFDTRMPTPYAAAIAIIAGLIVFAGSFGWRKAFGRGGAGGGGSRRRGARPRAGARSDAGGPDDSEAQEDSSLRPAPVPDATRRRSARRSERESP